MNGRTALGAGRLAGAALLALGLVACAGEDDSMLEIVGSLEGARFADEHHDDDHEGEEHGDEESGDAEHGDEEHGDEETEADHVEPAPVAAAAEEPEPEPAAVAAAPTHDPNDGVKAVRPANLPKGLQYLAFDDVAWPDYEPLDMRDVDAEAYGTDQFPAEVARLNGAHVAFDGYMVPVDFEDRRVTNFILSRYLPGCCFGVMPRMDEWIEVEVQIDGGVEYFPYQIVRVTGTFEVGEVLDDYGYVRSIYRIKADEVEEQL